MSLALVCNKPCQLVVLQTSTQNFVGGLGQGFEWIDAILFSHYQTQHGNHKEAGFMESQQDYFGEYLQQKRVSCISILLNDYQRKEEREE